MPPKTKRKTSGFTFVELVIAIGVGALVLTVAAISFSTIVRQSPGGVQADDVTLDNSDYTNFYGAASTTVVSVGRVPNYSSAAQAENMREALNDDVQTAIAVFCLGRDGRCTTRPTSITFNASVDGRTITNAAAFRSLLPNSGEFSATSVNAFTNANASIYILNASTNAYQVDVRAIYETDFIPTTSPVGIYASVRRYQGGVLTDYYHTFYADQTTNTFSPLTYFYPRGTNNSVSVNRPFYMVWWPDPAAISLPPAPASSSGSSAYTNMTGQSSLFFVIPQFPSL